MSNRSITYEDRVLIEYGKLLNISYSEIGSIIGKNKSSISREIKRNSFYQYNYFAGHAQQKCDKRRQRVRQKPKTNNNEIKETVKKYLKIKLSPDVIVGRLKLQKTSINISHESIYKLIYMDKKKGGDLWTMLPRKKKKRKKRFKGTDKRGNIKNLKSIHARPKSIENRRTKIHWEVDTIIGKNHKGSILTLTERKHRFGFARLLKNRETVTVFNEINKIISENKDLKFRSVTADRGLEFAGHCLIDSKTSFYFADKASPWQRGSNENFNGLLRRYFPKKTDFTKLSQKDIDKVVKEVNNMPRKILGYKSAHESIFDTPLLHL